MYFLLRLAGLEDRLHQVAVEVPNRAVEVQEVLREAHQGVPSREEEGQEAHQAGPIQEVEVQAVHQEDPSQEAAGREGPIQEEVGQVADQVGPNRGVAGQEVLREGRREADQKAGWQKCQCTLSDMR